MNEDFEKFLSLMRQCYEKGISDDNGNESFTCVWREMQQRSLKIACIAFDEWLSFEIQAESFERRWRQDGEAALG
jgi:hypothetical protein